MGGRGRNPDLLSLALVALTLGLTVFGLVMIYSATRSFDLAARQGAWLCVSLCAFAVLTRINYVEFMRVNRLVYLVVLVLLIAVLIPHVGKVVNGARSWIPLGPLGNLQPSEIAKIGIIITLATLLRNASVFGRHEVVPALIHVCMPVFLILLQPDFGTAMVFFVVLFVMLFVGGTDIKWMIGLFVTGAASIPLVIRYVLRDYQRERLLVFLDPYSDPLRSGWNVIQSLVSVGSGRLFGKGLFGSTQGRLGFLPLHHNDFIFALVCEEFGFIGASMVLAAYGAILFIGLKIALSAKDEFGRCLAGGIVALYLAHVVINVGMVVGLMPVTGIPLPFISYGGSSLLTNWIGLSLLVNVYSNRTRLSFR
ncbi:MAG: rod shape-determining protein RodA [Firmicutes bacterium]|nr:rod shape-determining protein RodA [Bacillota bacterium]